MHTGNDIINAVEEMWWIAYAIYLIIVRATTKDDPLLRVLLTTLSLFFVRLDLEPVGLAAMVVVTCGLVILDLYLFITDVGNDTK